MADYRDLTDGELRRREAAGERGTFIAEGELVVRALAASRFPVRSVLGTPERLAKVGDLLGALPPGTPAFAADPAVMERVVGFAFHRGLLAAGARVRGPGLDALVRDCRTLVVLEGLTNAENVGAAFRNVAALAGSDAGVLLSPGCCDPLYRKAVRVSMGHILRTPFDRADHWPGDLTTLRELGWRVLALTPGADAEPLRPWAVGQRVALLLGSEGPGLTAGAMARADARVRIPMTPNVDSLNVATAVAVALALGRGG